MSRLDELAALQLLVVTGKGGVGKSSLAATLGRILACAGKSILLLEADPRESLFQLLGLPPLGGSVADAGAGLRVQNVRPRDVVDELVRERVWIEFLLNRVLESSVYRHFVEGAPGLKEMAVLGHALRVLRGESSEALRGVGLVILDAPASGHGVSMMAAPRLVADVIRDGPVGQLAVDLAEFTANPQRCGVAVVTLAEEMPVTETIELVQSMKARLDRVPELIVVNGLYPPVDDSPRLLEPDLATMADLWRRRRRVNERERDRLTRAWSGPMIELPLLPYDRGPELVGALGSRLERALTDSGKSMKR
jgi:anion-transporting  ArsA/GET3 family ATPase